jgi:hypothetical protein
LDIEDDDELNEVCFETTDGMYPAFLTSVDSLIDHPWRAFDYFALCSGITLVKWNVFVVPKSSESSCAPGGREGCLSDCCFSALELWS